MSRSLVRVLRALALAMLFSAFAVGAAQAAAPALQLSGGPAASVLYGNALPVSLTASLPSGSATGYNLAFRVVLPAGVTYTPGSAGSIDGEPTILPNAPTTGKTTLVWPDTDDLVARSSHTLAFQTTYDKTLYDVGASVPIDSGAYLSADPRDEADFTATTGLPSGPGAGSFASSATTSGAAQLTAIKVAKSEPHPEGEIPRGLHDHQTVYTLTVTNNKVNPTNGVSLEDYLPDGLEFLGCAGTPDHTTNAPTNPGSAEEYPGSGPIVVAHPDASEHCVAPDLVETVQTDPDGVLGPLPFGVYTHVKWNSIGDFPASGVKTLTYAAAIPIRRNTMTWPGATPGLTGAQTSNLDNNSGAETTDEEPLLNGAIVAGAYAAPTKPTKAVSDEGTLLRTAEDLAIQKSNDNAGLEQGDLTKWTIDLQVSEYRYLNDVSITDVVPDGLCPLSSDPSVNEEHTPPAAEAECNGVAGHGPSQPYTSVDEQADGTYNVVWDKAQYGALSHLAPNDVTQLTFYTRTRHAYQQSFSASTPILSQDAVTNNISTSGAAFVRCQGGDPSCDAPSGNDKVDADGTDGGPVLDVSGSGKTANGPQILKTVADHYPASGNCNDLPGSAYGKTTPTYGPSDQACWKLHLVFPANLNTTSQDVFDVLPAGLSYVPGSQQVTSANTVTPVVFKGEDSGRLDWGLGTANDVATGGQVFDLTFATTVGAPAGHHSGDVEGNLMKFSYANTAGTAFTLRDAADFAVKLPELSLVKGVGAVNPASATSAPVLAANTDHQPVRGGDTVQYRVDVTNSGTADASASREWDELPSGIDCSMIVAGSISDGGSCATPGHKVVWTGVAIAHGATKTLTYETTVPTGVSPDQDYVNTAGVVEYTYTNNTGAPYQLIPSNSVVKDPSLPAANMPAAQDVSDVYTPGAAVVKTRTTSVSESGNAASNQATVGETVNYTVTTTIPKGTTLYGTPTVVDPLGAQQTLVPGSLCATACTLDGAALPAGVTVAESPANTITATFPATYANTTGHDVTLVLNFSAKVLDVSANTRGTSLGNTATLTFKDQAGRTVTHSGSVNTTIVEPKITATKTDGLSGARVVPGQVVDYTVKAAASSGTSFSTAHEVVVVDTLPAGTDPVLSGDGTVGPQHGVWNAGARTITWTKTSTPALATVNPGVTVALTYQATVESPSVSGRSYQNTVAEHTTSLDASVGGVRSSASPGSTASGYAANASDTIFVALPSLAKDVTPDQVTIGNKVVWHVHVTFPKNLQYYDATALDTVPDGFDVDGYGPIACVSGCLPGDPTATAFAPNTGAVQSDGTVKTAWWVGDLAPAASDRVYDLVLTGHLRDTYRSGGAKVLDAQTLTNKAWVAGDRTNKVSGTPSSAPGSFDDTVGPQTATNHVVEPKLAIDKSASEGPYAQGGDHVTYTVKITNNGDAPAYDTVVKDQPDTELTNVVLASGVSYATTTWSAGDRNVSWTYPGPLAAGDSVSFTYTADVVPSGALHASDRITNTATINAYYGVPAATRAADGFTYRTYTGPSDTVTLTPDFPALSLVKTTGATGFPDLANAQVGQPFSWRVVVTNSAHVAVAKHLSVVDTLPAGWSYTGPTTFSSGGGADPSVATHASGDALTWSNVTDLAPGASVTVTFTATPNLAATVAPGAGVGDAHPHVNTAVSSGTDASGASASGDGPYQSNRDTAKAVIHLPDLSIVKTPDNGAATAGTASSFTIKVTNHDTVAVGHNVKVHDVLPAGLTYTAGTATAAGGGAFTELSVSSDHQTVDWNVATLAPGATVTITMPVFVAANVPNGTLLTNTASTHADEVPSDTSDTGSLLVSTKADLQVTKTSDHDPVVPGTSLTYTIVTKNNGPSDAQNSTMVDTLPSYLSFVSLDDTSGCATAGQTITCSYGTLVSGASKTVHVTATLDPARTTPITNAADVTTDTTETNLSNNHDHADNTVTPTSDVSIVKRADQSHYNGGDLVTYTLTARNSGPSTAAGVVVTDPLPSDVTFVSASPAGANCTQAAGTVTCNVGSLAPGAALPIVIVAKANGEPPAASSTDAHGHQITVAKEERDLSVPAHQAVTQTLTCANGGAMVDGSFVIESVDQGEDVHGVHVVENDSTALGAYTFVVRNDTNGQAQVKVFGLCLPPQTEVTDGHAHAIVVGAPISTTSGALTVGLHTFHLDASAGSRAVAPGLDVLSGDAQLVTSEGDGHGGWDFTVDVTSPAQVTLSIRPLQETTGVTDGHRHDLLFSHPVVHATIPAGLTQVVRVTCPDGSKGVVATYDLPSGLVFRGNEPEPINRDFTVQNTTNGPLDVTVDLVCMSITTGPPIDDVVPVVNTGTIATGTPDTDQSNTTSSAAIVISRAAGSTAPAPDAAPSGSAPASADAPAPAPLASDAPRDGDAPPTVLSFRIGALVTIAATGDSAAVPIACTGTATCAGDVTISAAIPASGSASAKAKAKAKAAKIVLGTARYTVKPGQTVSVKVSVAKRYRTLLRSGRVRSVTVTAGKTTVSRKAVVAKKKATKKAPKKP